MREECSVGKENFSSSDLLDLKRVEYLNRRLHVEYYNQLIPDSHRLIFVLEHPEVIHCIVVENWLALNSPSVERLGLMWFDDLVHSSTRRKIN